MYELEKEYILSKFSQDIEKVIKCHDGWIPLILRLDQKITEVSPDYVITTIKEKYGLLNFYVSNVTDEAYVQVYDFIAEAEDESAYICEVCGKEGSEGILDSWWSVRCPNCVPPNWRSWQSIKEKYGID